MKAVGRYGSGRDRVYEDDATSALSVRNVVKTFGSGPNAVTALNNVSVDIQSNEFFTLLGPSGCGKTTLLRLTAGFEQPTDGEIFLFDQEIQNRSQLSDTDKNQECGKFVILNDRDRMWIQADVTCNSTRAKSDSRDSV